MNIVENLSGLRSLPAGSVISIGNFDGLHLGHQALLRTGKQLSRVDGDRPLAVVTFEPHPLTALRPELAPPRLTPPAEKQLLLEKSGVDYLVNLPPRPEVLNLSAEAFFEILRDEVRPGHLVEGQSFNFGKDRRGTVDRLREWITPADNLKLHIVPPVQVGLTTLHLVPVSSSLIRWLLAHGRVRDAAICLGRAFALHGTVIQGFQRGRTIGVPTANLDCKDQLVPADGVYAGRCTIHGATYPAAVSIGTLPTFKENRRQIEAHLVGFDGDLYGQQIAVELLDWQRPQRKYADIDALKVQIQRDIAMTVEQSHLNPALPPVSYTA